MLKQILTTIKSLSFAQRVGIAGCLVVLVLFSAQQGDVGRLFSKIHGMFSKAQSTKLTYEQLKLKALANSAGISDEDFKQNYAILDPKLRVGKVLGDTIGLGAKPIEELLPDEQLNKIVINPARSDNPNAIGDYVNYLDVVFLNHNQIQLLSDLNSDDPDTLNKASQEAIEIVSNLKAAEVPKEFETYHRYLTVYYYNFSKVAKIFSGEVKDKDMDVTIAALFGLSSKLDKMETELNKKYNVSL